MSTRGLWGFRKNGQDLLTYNHSDSYPSWLGKHICQFISDLMDEELDKFPDMLEPVDEDKPAAEGHIRFCKELGVADFAVASRKETDYYCLLRKTQGNFPFYEGLVKNPPECLKGSKLPFIISNSFILNSLFCEYAYIINMDKKCLEFWKGFQKKPYKGNRYGTEATDGYYPCRMLKAYAFTRIRKDGAEKTVADMAAEDAVCAIKDGGSIAPEEVMDFVRWYIPEDEVDHHGNGNGMDDLYLKKTKVSDAIVRKLKPNRLVTTFVCQTDGSIWYDLPFLYNEKK